MRSGDREFYTTAAPLDVNKASCSYLLLDRRESTPRFPATTDDMRAKKDQGRKGKKNELWNSDLVSVPEVYLCTSSLVLLLQDLGTLVGCTTGRRTGPSGGCRSLLFTQFLHTSCFSTSPRLLF